MNSKFIPAVLDSRRFRSAIEQVMGSIYDLMELAKEFDLSDTLKSDNGEPDLPCCKPCFAVSRQYDRPGEFLQVLLDIIRVNFEPEILGNLLLNSNMSFLYDAIPDEPFRMDYATMLSEPDQKFGQFWEQIATPRLKQIGCSPSLSVVTFAAATTGKDRYGYPFIEEVLDALGPMLTYDEAAALVMSALNGETCKTGSDTYSGFCLDAAMGRRIRLSLLMFTTSGKYLV